MADLLLSDHAFPTHEGVGNNSPGYSGINNCTYLIQIVESFEFNNVGSNFRLQTDIGVRFDAS